MRSLAFKAASCPAGTRMVFPSSTLKSVTPWSFRNVKILDASVSLTWVISTLYSFWFSVSTTAVATIRTTKTAATAIQTFLEMLLRRSFVLSRNALAFSFASFNRCHLLFSSSKRCARKG